MFLLMSYFGLGNVYWTFNLLAVFRLFEIFKIFIPRMDSAKQIPKEVQLFLLMSYFVLGNVYWTFNLQAVFRVFETLKMFYPPKGRLLADSCRGPIVFTCFILG